MLNFVYALALLPLAMSQQILVPVGPGGQLVYGNADIKAPVGTLVTFVFNGSIPHSVTESSFADPCTPLSSGGFDSGVTQGTTFSVNVTDANTPVYFFCKVTGHCGLGMVGTINAPASGNGSSSSFVAAAKALGGSAPADTDTGSKTGGSGAIATAGPTSGTPSVGGAAPSATAPSGSASSGSASASGSTSGSGSASSSSAASSGSATPTSGATQLAVSGGVGLLGLIAAAFAAL